MSTITLANIYLSCQILNEYLEGTGNPDRYHAIYQLGSIDLLKFKDGMQDKASLLNTYTTDQTKQCHDDILLIYRVLE